MDFFLTHPNFHGRAYHVTDVEDVQEAIDLVQDAEPRFTTSDDSIRQYATDVSDEDVLDAIQDRMPHGAEFIHIGA